MDADDDDSPHTLRPEPLVNAHLAPLHRSQQSQLNAKLQTTQSQNANLVEVLRRQRAEIEELLQAAERVVGDLESAGTKFGEGGGDLEGGGAGGRGFGWALRLRRIMRLSCGC